MAYLIVIIPIAILMTSILLGFLSRNYFVEFGLAIIIISAATSLIQAFLNGRAATKATRRDISEFIPAFDNSESHRFKFTAAIMGVDTRDPIKHLQRQIDELQARSIEDEKNFRSLSKFNEVRLDICFANIRFHEQVTLPKMLGQGAGLIVLASIMTIAGSVLLAFPNEIYSAAAQVALSISNVSSK